MDIDGEQGEEGTRLVSQSLFREWLTRVAGLKQFATVGDLDKLAADGEKARDALTWNTAERSSIIQIINLLINGSGQEARRQAEKLLQNMNMAPSKPARSAYHWTEAKIQEV